MERTTTWMAGETIPLLFKECSECCFIVTLLVCDGTTPMLSFSQLIQQGYECSLMSNHMEISLDEHFNIPIIPQGWHFSIEPASFCDDYNDEPFAVLPVCPEKPSMVSPAFAKSSMKRVLGGNTAYWEFFAGGNILRRVHKRPFVPNDRILPTRFQTDGLTARKTVVTKHGADDLRRREDFAPSERTTSRARGPLYRFD